MNTLSFDAELIVRKVEFTKDCGIVSMSPDSSFLNTIRLEICDNFDYFSPGDVVIARFQKKEY